MKIATNVNSDVFGGITVSNLALFDWLKEKEDTIVGIEFVMSRHFLGAAIFRHYEPSFFRHHIINAIDIIPSFDDPAQVAMAVRRLKRSPLTARERKEVAVLLDPSRVHGQILSVLRSTLAGKRIKKRDKTNR